MIELFPIDEVVQKVRRGELSIRTISADIGLDINKQKAVEKAFSELSMEELQSLGVEVIEFLSLISIFQRESEPFKKKIVEMKGEGYAKQFNTARLIAWQGFRSYEYTKVKEIQAILEEHKEINFREWELNDCRSPEEIRKKLELYNRLTKGRLPELYSPTAAEVCPIGEYKIVFSAGSWENAGGLELCTTQERKPLLFVGGKIHRHTNILSIHGGKDVQEAIIQFKEKMGIHPANLNLLLFLKLSQYLQHDAITIAGAASRAYNGLNIDSHLYLIPRNYFRLRVNSETNRYEFDSATRDKIIEKFAQKSETVSTAFNNLEAYLG